MKQALMVFNDLFMKFLKLKKITALGGEQQKKKIENVDNHDTFKRILTICFLPFKGNTQSDPHMRMKLNYTSSGNKYLHFKRSLCFSYFDFILEKTDHYRF